MRHIRTLGVIALLLTAGFPLHATGAEAASRPADPRWCDLPHTDTVFAPKAYATLDEWRARREHLRAQVLWAAGLLPMPERTPLSPQIFGRIERDGYTVEKVYFESYPGFLVTGNLYRPTAGGRHPGVACPHGHWKRGRINEEELGSIPARCITLARLGCVVFAYDMVGYNDSGRQIASHGFTNERGSLWGLESPLGFQLWNSIRVVDFLCSLPDVDSERIGCTGASGGGTQTFLLTAVDDRVKVSAPVNMISSIMQGGCVCENAPCLRFDTNNMEIGAMMAPRPMIMVSATGDWTKNTPNVEFPAIQAIYRLYGAEDRLGMVQINAPHNYNKASREAVYRWFGKWLLGRTDMDGFTEPPYPKEKDADLLVFADRPVPYNAVPNMETLIEWRIGVAKRRLDSMRAASGAAAIEARDLLRESMRLAMGVTPPGLGDIAFEAKGTATNDAIRTEAGTIIDRRRGTRVPASVFCPAEQPADAPAACTLLVHGQGRKPLLLSPSRMLPGEFGRKLVAAGQRVVVIDPFGIGEAVGVQDPQHPRGSTKFFSTFNRMDTAERVCDIAVAIEWCRLRTAGGPQTLNVVGLEQGGPWCLLACAVLDPLPPEVQLRVACDANAFDTSSEAAYRRDLYIPGILKTGGLPAAAAIVPAPLLLHNVGARHEDYAAWLKDKVASTRLAKDRLDEEAVYEWLTKAP